MTFHSFAKTIAYLRAYVDTSGSKDKVMICNAEDQTLTEVTRIEYVIERGCYVIFND